MQTQLETSFGEEAWDMLASAGCSGVWPMLTHYERIDIGAFWRRYQRVNPGAVPAACIAIILSQGIHAIKAPSIDMVRPTKGAHND